MVLHLNKSETKWGKKNRRGLDKMEITLIECSEWDKRTARNVIFTAVGDNSPIKLLANKQCHHNMVMNTVGHKFKTIVARNSNPHLPNQGSPWGYIEVAHPLVRINIQ